MRIDVITIFPSYLDPLRLSIVGRAAKVGAVTLVTHDLRDWTADVHRTVDDTPYGGGAGMLMRPEPWGDALDAVIATAGPPASAAGAGPRATVIMPSPAGRPFSQGLAAQFASLPWLIFACGRYEGIDARVPDHFASRPEVDSVEEISLGDYVLSGGEAATLVMVEAIVRLLPEVLGNPASLLEESHTDGVLEYPGFTKPAHWRGLDVPEVLRSGDHGAVARWRRDAALIRTSRRRPDLVAALHVDRCDRADVATLAAEGWVPGPDGRFLLRGEPVAD